MHDLLGDSPDTPPRDSPSFFDITSNLRVDIEETARQGQFDILRGVAYNRAWIIGQRYCRSQNSIDYCEQHLHDLWYTYHHWSKHLSHESPEQDKLVLNILRLRGRGPLTRPAPGGCGVDLARTPDGTVWNDLPFLATDMTDFWLNECAQMDANQRLNVSSFLAKLASTRMVKDRLCQIALILFRDTFESMQSLGSLDDPDNEDHHRTVHTLTIAALLPSACAWLREAGHNIILLTDVSWNDCSSSLYGTGGGRFVRSELGRRAPGGFGPWRWLYWFKRLHEIAEEAAKADEKRLAEYATKTIDVMISHVKQRNSRILEVFEAEVDTLQQDKDFEGLKGQF
ncbi:hypothetical protein APSETT444_000817 [Aspergillus pseudonomiae]|nr:uncharacterized protein ANOM_000907 [Aspergillus nomiae NRRL 13137]KNG90773.1 hypothetical protein ANOM_000907 [Aspergillus nomiae NRRL 13137]